MLTEMQLQRKHTMKRVSEFAAVRAWGDSHRGRYLVLSTMPLPAGRAEGHSLFGLIATKRLGHAVLRNRLRRRVREVLREVGDPLAVGLYVVVILRQSALQADYGSLRRDLEKLIVRHARAQTVPSCSEKLSS